jgi:Protein of unknown function (DUF2384)
MHARTAPQPVQDTDIETAGKALRVFFNITKAWGLTSAQEQVLLGTSKTTLFAWKGGTVRAGLEAATLERLSYIFRIYGALQILLAVPERANAWVKAANTAPLFAGSRALDRMLAGNVGDLMVVADYLDAQRGGDFA